MLPVPSSRAAWALFLDFDGTLTEIAATPDAVTIDAGLPSILLDIAKSMSGAVAIVSGRPIIQIDRLLAPALLPAAGQHGLERRRSDGSVDQISRYQQALNGVKEAMQPLAESDPQLLLEDKGLTVALHFRNAPDKASICRKTVQTAVNRFPDLELLEGKMVLEARPRNVNKGKAVQAFMSEGPYRGRVPVMVGDDVTDEDAFRLVNDLQGVTIKVGAGETQAHHRLSTVSDVLRWLKQLRDSLQPMD